MNAIDQQTQKIKKENRIGLMTHLVIGYPDATQTVALAKTLAEAGADFLELQIPFSDPVADGPTIMHACEDALAQGMTVQKAFPIIKQISKNVHIPLLIMAYYNTLFRFGVEEFCKTAEKAGIHGLIIPDMPIDEETHEHLNKYCNQYNLYLIRLTAPASTNERMALNAKDAQGFVYCVSRYGVTGSKSTIDPELKNYLKRAGEYFRIPLGVGFGISKPEHIKALRGYADIAIVGSAIINVINTTKKSSQLSAVKKYIKYLLSL